MNDFDFRCASAGGIDAAAAAGLRRKEHCRQARFHEGESVAMARLFRGTATSVFIGTGM